VIDMSIVRRTLHSVESLSVGHVVARPSSSKHGDIELQPVNILVLPLAGVFAKHDGPHRHVVATPNHAAFIAAGRPYRISYPGKIGDRCLTMRFPDEVLEQILPGALPRQTSGTPLLASCALVPPRLMLARNLLWSEYARGGWDPLEVEEAAGGILASALHLLHDGEGRKSSPRAAGRDIAETLKEAIALNPARKWTLAELAKLSGVSAFHLSRMFKQETGTSIYRYVLRERLAVALDALLATGANLTAIALETGFASHSHFTARFHAFFGLTPIAFRRSASAKSVAEMRKIVTARRISRC
jgi:AraC family transcriptional regulator